MTVSDRERAFMRRIGAIKSSAHADSVARHRALPIEERLQRSWALYLSMRSSVVHSEPDDDPSPFYQRARALGLYEP